MANPQVFVGVLGRPTNSDPTFSIVPDLFECPFGEPLGFLPVQRGSSYAAMPAGGPICDYQALVAKPGISLDLSAAPRALAVGRIDLTAGIAKNAVGQQLLTSDFGHVVRFPEGYEAW
jgi:hypothetical protein